MFIASRGVRCGRWKGERMIDPDLGGRRRVLSALAALSLAGLPTLGLSGAAVAQDLLPTTPSCDDGDEPTPEQTAGPFYLPSSPRRSVLREIDVAGTPITLAGHVLSRSCRPVPNVLVDIWHADDAGRYARRHVNLRALVGRAVKRFGMRAQPPAERAPLDPAWAALLEGARPAAFRWGVTRLARHCSAAGIAPRRCAPRPCSACTTRSRRSP
jgi:hypothetical protein